MKRRGTGFTLIELMIVVGIIAIIAAIAIPNLLRSRMSANEASAVSGMRTISSAETGFQAAAFVDTNRDGMGDYGTLQQLGDPDGNGASQPFIDQVLSTGNRFGYIYTANVVEGTEEEAPSYTCVAAPASAGRTGWRYFFVDETGVIRVSADGTEPSVDSPPLN